MLSGNANYWIVGDSVVNSGKFSILTKSDAAVTSGADIASFNSTGVTVGSGAYVNNSARQYIMIQMKESVESGFDIVSYTGNGTNRTITHNLNKTPEFIIIKRSDGIGDWVVYHSLVGNTSNLLFNSLATGSVADSTMWNNTNPTSTTFSLGTNINVNESGGSYVAYVFTSIPGYSKIGSYIGNGLTQGPFVYCGFQPQFILAKRAFSSADWSAFNTSRVDYNVGNEYAIPLNTKSSTIVVYGHALNYMNIGVNGLSNNFFGSSVINISATGFYYNSNTANNNQLNSSTAQVAYIAFAKHPFKTSRGV
jgi:hypothetical protein